MAYAGPEDEHLPIGYAVCGFHSQALDAGDSWQVSAENPDELLLGSHGALQLITFTVETRAVALPLITLVFGHDDIESNRVTFLATPEQIQNLCYWAGPEGSHPGVA
jgi:hypothetical protein